MSDADERLSKELASMVGLGKASHETKRSKERLRQLIAAGQLPAFRTQIGYLVRASDIEKLARSDAR